MEMTGNEEPEVNEVPVSDSMGGNPASTETLEDAFSWPLFTVLVMSNLSTKYSNSFLGSDTAADRSRRHMGVSGRSAVVLAGNLGGVGGFLGIAPSAAEVVLGSKLPVCKRDFGTGTSLGTTIYSCPAIIKH